MTENEKHHQKTTKLEINQLLVVHQNIPWKAIVRNPYSILLQEYE